MKRSSWREARGSSEKLWGSSGKLWEALGKLWEALGKLVEKLVGRSSGKPWGEALGSSGEPHATYGGYRST